MSVARYQFNHYEYAKINSSELWRFYIDAGCQNTKEGKAKGRDLFEDEKGYMDGMMRAHHYLNKEWDKNLSAEFILNLHAHAVTNVRSADRDMPGLLVDDGCLFHFKNNLLVGFDLSSENTSINGLVEWFDKIITEKIPYATLQKNYTLAKKGPDCLPENIGFVFTDILYEELKGYKLKHVCEAITQLSSEIKLLPGRLAELNLEQEIEEKKMKALQCSRKVSKKTSDDELNFLKQVSWEYLDKLSVKRIEINCELRDKAVLLNRMTVLEKLKELKKEGGLLEIATQILAKINDCFFTPPLYTSEENTLIVREFIQKYLDAIKIASNDNERKLDIIIEFIQSLEQLHPFIDGNCRVFVMLLLNSELIKNGFPPTMLDNPNRFDLFSKKELADEIKKGWKYAAQFHSQIAKLPAFKELYDLVFSPDNLQLSTSITQLFHLFDLSEVKRKLQILLYKIKDKKPTIAVLEINAFSAAIQIKEGAIKSLLDKLSEQIESLKPISLCQHKTETITMKST